MPADAVAQLDLFAAEPRGRFPAGHVVHMSLDHSAAPSLSIAECDCGWTHREPWLPGRYRFADAAIEAHWQAAEN